jgi:hypothetical protein
MDEFKKPYEYQDEPVISGFLSVFTLSLLLEMCYGIIVAVQLDKAFGSIPVLGKILLAASILFILLVLFTCFSMYKIQNHAVSTAKAYLIIRSAFLTAAAALVFIHTLNDKRAIGPGPDQFYTFGQMLTTVLINPMVYVLVYGIAWYIYFCRSKRVRRTFFGETM